MIVPTTTRPLTSAAAPGIAGAPAAVTAASAGTDAPAATVRSEAADTVTPDCSPASSSTDFAAVWRDALVTLGRPEVVADEDFSPAGAAPEVESVSESVSESGADVVWSTGSGTVPPSPLPGSATGTVSSSDSVGSLLDSAVARAVGPAVRTVRTDFRPGFARPVEVPARSEPVAADVRSGREGDVEELDVVPPSLPSAGAAAAVPAENDSARPTPSAPRPPVIQ